MSIVLHQFNYSHFNEKARWGLAFKGVEHNRLSYLPGPHAPAMEKLSGTSQTPVLEWEGDVCAGSTAILRLLEERCEGSPLFPDDAAALSEVDDLIRYFDDEVGPATRTLLFSVLVHHGAYMAGMFARDKSSLKRFAYRWTFPLVRPLIAKQYGLNAENLTRCRKGVDEALDLVVEKTADTGFLVGDSFTAADLTAAALLAPLVDLDHEDMARPRPVPADMASLQAEFADHAGVAWVNKVYAEHRP